MSKVRISRAEALQISHQILDRAERERAQAVDQEAARGIQYGEEDSRVLEKA